MRLRKLTILLLLTMFLIGGCFGCGPAADTPAPASGNTDSRQTEEGGDTMPKTFTITANGTTFTADFVDNSSAEALAKLLEDGDLTIDMRDYDNFEKVGSLGTSLPTNDRRITTEAGDVILYQENTLTIYYDSNTWSFTRLGKIRNASKSELLQAFGDGDVTVTLSLGK